MSKRNKKILKQRGQFTPKSRGPLKKSSTFPCIQEHCLLAQQSVVYNGNCCFLFCFDYKAPRAGMERDWPRTKEIRASIENTPALLEEETFRALRAFKQWEDRVLDKPENLLHRILSHFCLYCYLFLSLLSGYFPSAPKHINANIR